MEPNYRNRHILTGDLRCIDCQRWCRPAIFLIVWWLFNVIVFTWVDYHLVYGRRNSYYSYSKSFLIHKNLVAILCSEIFYLKRPTNIGASTYYDCLTQVVSAGSVKRSAYTQQSIRNNESYLLTGRKLLQHHRPVLLP